MVHGRGCGGVRLRGDRRRSRLWRERRLEGATLTKKRKSRTNKTGLCPRMGCRGKIRRKGEKLCRKHWLEEKVGLLRKQLKEE